MFPVLLGKCQNSREHWENQSSCNQRGRGWVLRTPVWAAWGGVCMGMVRMRCLDTKPKGYMLLKLLCADMEPGKLS